MTPARFVAPLSLALLTACAQTPRNIVSIDTQSDCPLTLKPGQTLILTLPSNPTTGFRWLIQNPAPTVLHSLGPEVYANAESKEMVGSGGQSVWRYKATDVGTGKLLMTYQQPWAPEVPPEQTFECAISVN
ncbi:protease inhibitor I42 family protein [Pseudomonas cannabina]|uniref:Lipoprotein n=3 Tax=Pseudomonas syringae group TaxID=136849 RepID=A0A3M3RCK1_PSECA|nr:MULTISPECIES: protease inhibitor I42 family protein [Pseudomonas syringae group]KPB73230.1 Lipoprotein [Pseudomonas syringae pv. maculicola]KPW21548.1 Lipoprotein [Pseudomonas cannabina pv. alisalensis]MBM0141968.1 protease inhibitor I42 family protein [Pseudomonas cannabina pv. alisalensis]QHE98730.1 peptidase inhibitor I42 [Pseudomonas syringae pv. maculicola str. ES4326]QQN20946.1 protease inhibitor I42 family protein [Pseudomonas cannabina pv. alisalensis]